MKEYIVPVANTDRDYEEMFIGFIRKREELIRCKECTRFRAVEDSPYGICWLFSRHPSPESFCDRAERRGEE